MPYLRLKKFPRSRFPKLYEYRPVAERLETKVRRAFRRMPKLDFRLSRRCYGTRAEKQRFSTRVGSILTSPPYMRQLDYGRATACASGSSAVTTGRHSTPSSLPEGEGVSVADAAMSERWKQLLVVGGHCVLVIGDTSSRSRRTNLPDMVAAIAKKAGYARVRKRPARGPWPDCRQNCVKLQSCTDSPFVSPSSH